MEIAKLPTEKAFEPDEEAWQPMDETMMSPPFEQNIPNKPNETLSKMVTNKKSSYKSSQPAPALSHREKLQWLQQRRAAGLWAQCDDCNRWRYLPTVLDTYDLPNKWYCHMNPDPATANCSIPEAPIRIHEEEDLIHSEYSAGSLVWARMPGWPWWPAMVDDCPDTEQFYWLDGFSDIPTHYNVVFFDSMEVSRAWIAPNNLKPYAASRNMFKHQLKNKKYKKRLEVAARQADDALKTSLGNRLEKYSFIARYKGNISSPNRINKKTVEAHKKKLMRKFNIEFPNGDSSDSDECSDIRPAASTEKRKNVIILGTPKKAKPASNRVPKIADGGDSIDIPKTANDDTEPAVNTYKHPNSMAVQVGSTLDSTGNESFDNDTSKTYVPENGTESTDFCVRIATPNSDDFDF